MTSSSAVPETRLYVPQGFGFRYVFLQDLRPDWAALASGARLVEHCCGIRDPGGILHGDDDRCARRPSPACQKAPYTLYVTPKSVLYS